MTLLHDVYFQVSFSGSHPLDPPDDARFVPSSDGGCASAASAAGGVIRSGLAVGVQLGVGVYELCLAEAPYRSGAVVAVGTDFDYHPHVTLVVVHEPPSAPPSPPPPPPSPSSPFPRLPPSLPPSPLAPPPHPPLSFAVQTSLLISASASRGLALTIDQLSSRLSSASTQSSTVVSISSVQVSLFQRSSVTITIPAGQSSDQVAEALRASYCGDSPQCTVESDSTSRRRLQSAKHFIISEPLVASSTQSSASVSTLLQPPLINTTDLSRLLDVDKDQLQVHPHAEPMQSPCLAGRCCAGPLALAE